MLVSGQRQALSTFSLGIWILVTTGQKLDGLQSQVHSAMKIKSLPLPEVKPICRV